MRKKTFLMGTFLSFIIAAAGLHPGVSCAKTITLKVAAYDAEQHFLIQKVSLPYCAEIEKRTNGQVKFQWYHSGSLVKANQSYDAVKNGIVDMMLQVAIFTMESRFPVSKVLSLPFMFDSSLQADLAYQEAFNTIPEIRKEYDDVKVIGFHMTDSGNFSSVGKMVKTLDDMKGLQVWGGSKTMIEVIKLTGATPRSVKLEDLYMSLQRHSLDGVMFPTPPLVHFKLTEVLNHHTITMAGAGNMAPMMNKSTWNSLPKDVQKVFEEMSPQFTAFCGAIVNDRRADVLAQLEKRGDKVYFLPPEERAKWKERVSPIYDEWLADMAKKGIDGKSILMKVEALAEKYKDAKYQEASWWPSDWKKMKDN